MADARDQVIKCHNELLQEWNKKPHKLDVVEKLLGVLKIELTRLTFLPTAAAQESELARLKQDLIVARDVLEVGVMWSVEARNTESFERYMAQLKSYYFDYRRVVVSNQCRANCWPLHIHRLVLIVYFLLDSFLSCREYLPRSEYMYQLLGLNLLALLSQNRVAEFHTVSVLAAVDTDSHPVSC